jgi:ABC-type sugar transport system ATPase subunit
VTALPQHGLERLPEEAPAPGTRILEMMGVTKRFPGTLALDTVDFTVNRSEIHALVGQNGAGKSTLMKILAGDYAATAGSIAIDGRPVTIRNTRQARRLGIGVVYQELSLLPNLTVAENMFLGREPVQLVHLNQRDLVRSAREALDQMGIAHIDVQARVARLSLAERQLVEIAKVLALNPRILILDEPTAPLTQDDVERLFSILRSLKRRDIGIIYITHRFKEVLSLCDRGTVLRGGRVVSLFETKDTTLDHLVEATLGQKQEAFFRQNVEHIGVRREEALVVRNLSAGKRVRDVDFDIRRGEIVGICGLLGAGQSEVGRALFGDQSEVTGTIELNGKRVTLRSPRQAKQLGIGFLSDSRREEGLFPEMLSEENISIASLTRFIWTKIFPFIRKRAARRAITNVATNAGVAPSALPRPVRFLSGGNQQKVVLSRWLLHDSEILVFLEPTAGIDVGAKNEIYRRLEALAHEGKSILVISTDIPEILGLSDRIFVMYHGSLTAVYSRDEATEEKIVRAMQGADSRVGSQ